MSRNFETRMLVLTMSLAFAVACEGGSRASNIQRSSDTDSERVWMALLKGFEGDVVYEGSDAEYAYFRLGRVFKSYHKLPTCAVYLPETFPLEAGRSYVVGFHVQEDKTIRMEGACKNYTGHVLGHLDHLRTR